MLEAERLSRRVIGPHDLATLASAIEREIAHTTTLTLTAEIASPYRLTVTLGHLPPRVVMARVRCRC
jgi:hypothetical protein